MSSSKAGIEGQDPLITTEREITELKEEKRELKSKIRAFQKDKSPKDKTSRNENLEDIRRLTALENRLAGLEARRERLEAQVSAPPQLQQGKCDLTNLINCSH